MANIRLKNAGRRKAPFGSQEAAILGAAAIGALAQAQASAANVKAMTDKAKSDAQAIKSGADRQAQAIKEQTERSNEYQQASQEFISEQNDQNRELQKDIQMQLQMLNGAQNVNDRLEASKIKVRNGGHTRRRLRNAGNATFLLQGSYNMPFKVTDGGGVVALGTTPEGYDLYEIYGNDHEHYHKAQGGKNKTGVGIKFADGNVIEGEGNQNGTRGEKMLVTPNNAYFISRHTMKGFNPAKAVDEGLNPIQAYILQEAIKAENGISDDGKGNSPVKRYMIGGQPNIYDMFNQSGPQPGMDTLGDTAVGVAYTSNTDTKRRLRCGGKVRYKAPLGLSWRQNNLTYNNPNSINTSYYTTNPVITANIPQRLNINNTITDAPKQSPYAGLVGADLFGAGINALNNLTTPRFTSDANRRAARTLIDTKSKLRCGGKTRQKADRGWDFTKTWWNTDTKKGNPTASIMLPITPNSNEFTAVGSTSPTSSSQSFWSKAGGWINNNADLVGAGIGAFGNLGGAWITSAGNRRAARTLANAYNTAANTMRDAYNSLQTIDMNSLKREDYAAAHAMAALQAPVSQAAQPLAQVDRQLQRRLTNAGRYSASGAAAESRMARAEVDAQDMRNRIYAADQEQMQKIRQENANRVNEVAMRNAELDTQANKDFTGAYLNLLQYNNDIENTKILGAAGALSEGAVNSAGALSQAQTSNAAAWANALTGSTQGFANTLSNYAKRRADLANVMLGASTEAQVRQLGLTGGTREKQLYINRFQDAINSGKLSKEDEAKYKRYIQWLS